jgi:uncharacterized lipoprotein YddW (UPF0748 family)
LAFAVMLCGFWGCRIESSNPDSERRASDAEGVQLSADARQVRPRGMWVLCEGSQRALSQVSRVDALLERAAQLQVTDLFVQVYRGGRAWYDSDLADDSPYRSILASNGRDTLAYLLEHAHSRGLRIHAWVNVLSLAQNRDAPLLREYGREVVLVDGRGRSLLDYPELEIPAPDAAWYRMGTRGIYLDPAVPDVAERLVATFEELLLRYPELDGLHLDYIRHPGALPFSPGSRFGVGLDFGYGSASRQRFERETGLRAPAAAPRTPGNPKSGNANEWDAWRRQKVTELVAAIARMSRSIRPGLTLSAAVNSYVDRAYLSLAQDWQRWLEEGSIDLAIPMVYTLDDRLLRYQLENFANGPEREHIWSGLGVWLFKDSPGRALGQLEISQRVGIEAEVLFSYDAIADSPQLATALVAAISKPPLAKALNPGAPEASGHLPGFP